jgi:hypothetical protein
MADAYSQLAQTLMNARQGAYNRNPYLTGSQLLEGTQTTTPYGGAAKSIIQGLLAGYGMKTANEENQAIQKDVFNAVKSGDFNSLMQDPNMSDMGTALQLQQLGADQAVRREMLMKGLKLNDDGSVSPVEGFGEAVTANERAKIPRLPTAMPDSGSSAGPDLGVPGLDIVEKQLFAENVNSGMPPIQAAASAREAVSNMRKQSKDLYGKRMGEEADTIAQMEEIIRKGKQGMEMAGNTGSGLASAYEKTVATLAPFLPGSQEEAQRQAAGDTLLDQTKQLGAQMGRIVGSGAMTDFETRALMNTAMGSDKPNASNEVILQQYQNGLGIMKEHNDFMNYFMEKTGSNPQRAQSLWELYKRENPIVTEDGQLNPNRKPWQQFDFKGAYSNFMRGESPQPQEQASPTKVVGGQTYQKVPGGWQLVGQ